MKLLRPEEVTSDTVLKYDCTPEELAEFGYKNSRPTYEIVI
jgi:hypothetical protein